MKKTRSLLTTLIIVLAVIIYAVFFLKSAPGPEETLPNGGELTVTFIDIGQGDSELIQQGGNAVLIDTGEYSQRKKLADTLNSLGVTSLDYAISTHPHTDHMGSMDVVINTYNVRHIMMPDVTSTSVAFEKMMQAISDKGLRIERPVPGKSINAGSIELEIFAPNSSKYQDVNNSSIVAKLKWGKTSFIFEGDADALSEKDILGKGFDVSADVLKVGHHGSNTSTTDAYLDAVNPGMAVISCAAGNIYGHPHKEVMDKLNKKGIAVYRTDTMGTITMHSDGVNITVETEK